MKKDNLNTTHQNITFPDSQDRNFTKIGVIKAKTRQKSRLYIKILKYNKHILY
jgi:hypothetical protein